MIYHILLVFFSLFPGLYLKLTLPADVDIFAERDNPTHYADGFHCNIRATARLCNAVLKFGFGMNAM